MVSNSAGYQCTAIALVAILFASCKILPSGRFWSSHDIDLILNRGHDVYEQIIAASGNLIPRYLGHWELPTAIELDNGIVNVTYYSDIFVFVCGRRGVGGEVNALNYGISQEFDGGSGRVKGHAK